MPVVFVQVTDPVGQGLVSNLARPGGNLTGFTSFEFSIGTKWLEMLKVVAPHVTRVALVFSPETAPFADPFRRPVEAAAPSFDVTPVAAAARDAAEIERVLEAFAREPNGGLMVLPDVTTTNHRDLIIALAARHRLPAVYPFRYFATSGGLMSYGTDVRRRVSARGRLCRPHPQGRPSGRPAGAGADQVRTGDQPESRQGARHRCRRVLLARADEVIE